MRKEQTDVPLPLPLHQSSKPFILLHLCRLLRGKESDKLSQFFAGGVIELACGFGRHDFGEDGQKGWGQGDHRWVGFLVWFDVSLDSVESSLKVSYRA